MIDAEFDASSGLMTELGIIAEPAAAVRALVWFLLAGGVAGVGMVLRGDSIVHTINSLPDSELIR